MIQKCESTDSLGLSFGNGLTFGNGLERLTSNQALNVHSRFGLKPDDHLDSAFRRVTSHTDDELRLHEGEGMSNWFRQHTKEILPFHEDQSIDQLGRTQDSYIGKIASRTFSDFRPFCSLRSIQSSVESTPFKTRTLKEQPPV